MNDSFQRAITAVVSFLFACADPHHISAAVHHFTVSPAGQEKPALTTLFLIDDRFFLLTGPIDSGDDDVTQTCSNGIVGFDANGVVCCPLTCGGCAGTGCNSMPGGSSQCCGGGIKASGILCSASGEAPCIIDEGTCVYVWFTAVSHVVVAVPLPIVSSRQKMVCDVRVRRVTARVQANGRPLPRHPLLPCRPGPSSLVSDWHGCASHVGCASAGDSCTEWQTRSTRVLGFSP